MLMISCYKNKKYLKLKNAFNRKTFLSDKAKYVRNKIKKINRAYEARFVPSYCLDNKH